MADVVNPGLVNVVDEVLENPDPNNSIRLLVPEDTDALTAVADQGYPPAPSTSTSFPTPKEVVITQVPTGQVVLSTPVPPAVEIDPSEQTFGQGSWQPTQTQLVIAQVEIIISQGFTDSVALDPVATTLTLAPSDSSDLALFGTAKPTDLGTTDLDVNVAANGANLVATITLIPATPPTPVPTFAQLTAGSFSVTVTYNDGSVGVYGLTLGQLQALGAVSTATLVLGPLAPAASIPTGQLGFTPPAEFLVIGPNQSVQTNDTDDTYITYPIIAVYDADAYPSPATVDTTRYLIFIGPPKLTSYPISLLGRQVVFGDATLTVPDQGAVRNITGYSGTWFVIDKEDTTDTNVPEMVPPQVGDTFTINVSRQGAQDVSFTSGASLDVTIFPPPPVLPPPPGQALQSMGNINVSTGKQPVLPPLMGGVGVPSAITVQVADQATAVGLPTNVNVP